MHQHAIILSAPLPNFETHYLSSPEILALTKALVADERRATVALIEHLEEIQTRLLYAELGYSSLWEFATRELGLSEGAAQRRIQAMRLVRDVPEAKEKLESGRLSLSNAAKVQSFRQAEKKQGRKPDPKALITQVESLSQKECEKVLYQISPASLPTERERIVSAEGAREITLVVSEKLYEKLQRLKGLLAHSMSKANSGALRVTVPGASYADLFEYLADLSLRVIEKKKGILGEPQDALQDKRVKDLVFRDQVSSVTSIAAAAVESASPLSIGNRGSASLENCGSKLLSKRVPPPPLPAETCALITNQRISIPATIKRAVWSKAQGRCQIVTQTQRCTSRFWLEIDHITPLALGGTNEVSNLRLVCSPHNQLNLMGNLGES